jgi:hypothetical protein
MRFNFTCSACNHDLSPASGFDGRVRILVCRLCSARHYLGSNAQGHLLRYLGNLVPSIPLARHGIHRLNHLDLAGCRDQVTDSNLNMRQPLQDWPEFASLQN